MVMSLSFDALIINRTLTMTEPDPFKLLVKTEGDVQCTMEYTGPKNVILS